MRVYSTFQDFNKSVIYHAESSDTVFVINFWATWCKPCIEEIPYFLELARKNNDQKLKLLMVSLDFKNQIESRLNPYVEKNQLGEFVVALTDSKYNNWIDVVDPSWSGAIPATLFVRGKKKFFFEGPFKSVSEIEHYIQKLKD